MNRYGVTAFFGILMVPMALLADEKERNQPAKLPPREFVYWKPECNVKDPILKELDRFGKDMKAKLGETLLGHKPFIAIDNSPEAVALAETTVEQIVDRMLATLKTCADHDNEDFLPKFVACRRSPIASGSDLVTEPIGGLASVGQYSGNITFKFEW
ncbi:MAG: hypothetical protein KDA71_09460, partial [Planctomycetales bacterium]|nr:hypothetical protein [Planctomycetales bacterium]